MNPQSEARLEQLVNALLRALVEIKTLVGHRFPDDDVWFCCWMAKKFIPKAANAEIVFVNAGTALPDSEDDPSVIHFDTGGGEFDQHNKERARTSSATLLAEELNLTQVPGLKALLDMVVAVDNVEPLPPTSIHYAIEGYPRMFKGDANGAIDWQKVQKRVFELFDIIYGQETQRAQARENLQKHAVWTTLPNGLKIVSLLWNPHLREAAFEQGADVVLWTQTRWTKGFYVGVQRNRRLPQLSLRGVAIHLREEEAYLRQIQVVRRDLDYLGREGPVSNWFLHQSLGLVLSGSRTWELTKEEYTKIYPGRLTELVKRPLSAIPQDQVDGWRRQP